MNTLSEQSWQSGVKRVENFRYPTIQPVDGVAPELLGMVGSDGRKTRDLALQQEIAAAVEAARKQGFQQGVAQANSAAAKAISQERQAVQQALRDFAAQQKDYFRRIESEAVRLALSIARKVLHREAQMDPLLLAGVVRVALDRMQAGTRVALRVSPTSASSWRENLAGSLSVEVVPDGAFQDSQCVLETTAGTTEISLDAQLSEIESGFFDLLQEKVGAEK